MDIRESGAADGNPVLADLVRRMRRLRTHPKAPWFGRWPYPLSATVTGSGSEVRTSDYDWHGIRRGSVEFVLFQYTLAGEGRLAFHGREQVVRPGTAMLLHFPDDNRYWLPEGGMWEHFYLCMAGKEMMQACRTVVERKGPLLELAPDSAPVAQAALACERCLRGQVTSPFESSALAYAIAMELLQWAHESPAPGDHAGQLQRAMYYCRQRIADDIGVEDMARAAGYSRYHFTRLFTQAHGISPSDWLVDLRVTTAAKLLRDAGATVKEVAAACGFADPAYFCKVFRKAIGVSPGAFRDSGMYTG